MLNKLLVFRFAQVKEAAKQTAKQVIKGGKQDQAKQGATKQQQEPQKDNTRELLDKLHAQSFTITRDGYLVRVGLIIERKPIFLKADEDEMQLRKFNYTIKKKYNLMPQLSKELFDFNMRDPVNYANEIPTHMIESEKGEKIYYFSKSKHFRNVDPTVDNPSSIQYMSCYHTYMMFKKEDEWVFPTAVVQDRQGFLEAREILLKDISQNKWSVYLKSHFPLVVQRQEHQDTRDSRIKGTKTFYFVGNHNDGDISLHGPWNTTMHWVPRGHFNKYVTKDVYEDFVGIMSV